MDAINKTVTEVKNNGIESYKQIEHQLKQISRNTDIFNPKDAKEYIKNMTKETATKYKTAQNKMVFSYDFFCQNQNLCWEKPYYKIDDTIPLIPTTDH